MLARREDHRAFRQYCLGRFARVNSVRRRCMHSDGRIISCPDQHSAADRLRALRVVVVGGTEITHGLSTQTLKNGEALAAEVVSSCQAPLSVAMPCAVGSAAKAVVDGADSDYRLYALSEREEQILQALVHGYSNKMIGRKIG